MAFPNKPPKRPRVVPRLDAPSIQHRTESRIYDALMNDKRDADIIKDVYGPEKAEIDSVYQQAKSLSAPDTPPAAGGFPGMAHYPINLTDMDGTRNTGTIGRGTLLQTLTDQWGPERASEIARNMTERNRGQVDPNDIFPSIHPDGGDAHFNRPIYVIREDGPAEQNGVASPGRDTIRYRKADEGRTGDMETHETNHLAVEYGGRTNDRNFFTSTREDSPKFWKGLIAGDVDNVMGDSMSRMLQEVAEDYGFDYSPAEGEWGAMSPEDMDMIFSNADRHFWKNQEQLANLMSWKNLALRRNGYKTLADLPPGVAERDFFRNALTQDLTPFSPREAVEGFNPDHYNPLQLMFRSMRENLTPEGAVLQDKVIHRLGAAGAVAAGLSQEGDR